MEEADGKGPATPERETTRRRNFLKLTAAVVGGTVVSEKAAAAGTDFRITAQTTTGPVEPGGNFSIYPVVTNDGDATGDPSAYFQSTYNSDHNADFFGDKFDVVSHDDDGGDWEYEGWSWEDVEPGGSREPSVELEVDNSVDPGEYTFAIDVLTNNEYDNPDDTATATITVEDESGEPVLSLTLTDDTVTAGGTAVVEYILTNTGDGKSTGLQGYIGIPSDELELASSGDFDSIEPGETETRIAELDVPQDASGEYTIQGQVVDDAENEAFDFATVTVEPATELELKVSDATASPGGTATVTYALSNSGTDAVGGDSAFVAPVAGESPPGTNRNEGPVDGPDGSGGLDGKTWYEWTVEPGEELTAELNLALPDDIAPGEYEFTVEAEVESVLDSDTATITVENGTGISRFDQGDTGSIMFPDVLNAIAAHNEGREVGGEPVTFPDVLEVISAHNQERSV